MNNAKEIIQWSKENKYFLICKHNIEAFKNAQPNTILPDNIQINTAQFANFFGDLIEKFEIACVKLEHIDELEYELKTTLLFPCNSEFKEMERQLKSANETMEVMQKFKEVTDEGYRKLLGECGELQNKLTIARSALESIAAYENEVVSKLYGTSFTSLLVNETLEQIKGKYDK